jgi:hypothetical protein
VRFSRRIPPVEPAVRAADHANYNGSVLPTKENAMAEPELPKDMFEFMQKMWNPMSFPIPGMLTPTVDPAEIEKKIAELKSIENWLTMNVGFVQMTIKTLEMQKAALESLQAPGKPDKA